MDVVTEAKACADMLSRIDCTHKDAMEGARIIQALLSIVERLPKDAIDALPKDYCRGCLYSLLRWNRKNGVECADCYDADDGGPQSLDDHNYDAIVAVLDWAFAAAEAAGGEA